MWSILSSGLTVGTYLGFEPVVHALSKDDQASDLVVAGQLRATKNCAQFCLAHCVVFIVEELNDLVET